MKKKGLILRTIPIDKFNYFLAELNKKIDINDFDLLIQNDVLDEIQNDYNLNFISIEPGHFNIVKGLRYLNFFKYDKVILPTNNFDVEENINLLFFIFPILSKKYYLYYPDFSYKEYSFIKFISFVILHMLSELLIYIIFLLIMPIAFMCELFCKIKNKFSGK